MKKELIYNQMAKSEKEVDDLLNNLGIRCSYKS